MVLVRQGPLFVPFPIEVTVLLLFSAEIGGVVPFAEVILLAFL